MTDDQSNSTHLPAHYTAQPPHDWGTALVTACLVIGFVMSWAVYEIRQRLAQEASVVHFRHDLDFLVSQQTDLGRLLADPRTELIRLQPVDGNWPVRDARLAWNDDLQAGALFCPMATEFSGERFRIWLVPASGRAAGADVGPAEPGRTVYPFSPNGHAGVPMQFLLENWSSADQPDGAVLAKGDVKSVD